MYGWLELFVLFQNDSLYCGGAGRGEANALGSGRHLLLLGNDNAE